MTHIQERGKQHERSEQAHYRNAEARERIKRCRRIDHSGLLQIVVLVVLLPFTAAALLPVRWLFGQLVAPVSVGVFLVGYLASGVVLVARPVQRVLLRRLFGLRRPAAAEHAILDPAWRVVAERAGVPADRYLLAVDEDRHVNAYAAGGHLIAVTAAALRVLPRDQLEAVLAHELGHHLSLHSTVGLARMWVEAPVRVLSRITDDLSKAAAWMTTGLAIARLPLAGAAAALIGLGLLAVAVLLQLVVRLSTLASRILSRPGEYQADRAAADFGYGRQLVAALERLDQLDRAAAKPSRRNRMSSSHPALTKRIERIRQHSSIDESSSRGLEQTTGHVATA